ncbi:S-layer homology domain-containing protein [Agathobaculum butyriciproducens]|uniref:S-layer homology domain-containing protein n=1 Tax=Agathobaculum butyriciproducens TaxID=1628085 RepID=UPI003AF08BD7
MKKRVLSMFMALALCLTLLPAPAWAAEADAPEGGTIVQEEQQEKAPAAESPAILEQAAENGIAAQNGGDSTVENAVAEVTSGGEVAYYKDFHTALNAARAGDTLTLLTDVKGGDRVTIDKAITFDLNGHKIYALTVRCKITLKDSAGGTGKIAEWLRVENGLKIGDLLEEGYALRNAETGAWYGATEQTVGNVTVQQVPITSVTLTALNADGTAASTSIPYGTTGGIKLSASCDAKPGAGELSCQWHTIGGTLQLIDGATKPVYQLPADLSVGEYTYRVTFTADGYSKSADITITVTAPKIDLANATVTIDPWYTDGKVRFNPYAPETAALSFLSTVKVTANGKEYTLSDSDFTCTGATATRVGKYTLTITAKDSCANFKGSKTFDWEVIPYQLFRPIFQGSQTYTKTYDGTTTLPGSYTWLADFFGKEGTDSNVTLKSGDYEVTAAEFVSADAGENKPINQTITLKNENFVFYPTEIINIPGITTTDKTLTYTNFTPKEAYPTAGTTFNIEKATMPDVDNAFTLKVINNHADTYTVDLAALLPNLESPKKYGEVTYELGAVSINGGYYNATKGSAEVKDGKLILPIQAVETKETGSIGSVKVNVSTTNYQDFTLTVNVNAANKSVSSSGGGGSSSASKTSTTTNADGSVTKTEIKADGTVIATTTAKDGSVTRIETKPDGSSVTQRTLADGSTGTVKTDKNGQTTAETALSSKAIEDAKRNGEPVKAPVEVEATRNSSTAPTVKIELPRNSGETKVEIPVSNVKPGTVAVLVHADGTEEIVKNSLPTEDGIQLTVNGGATVKIVDNSKDFIDTRSHWAKDAIDFVSARELVNGMNDSIYAPNNSTTRAQLWTILARQNDADLNGGNTWYEKAQLWSKNKGISDGTEPNAAINRAQMVTMLWRAAGQPTAGGTANFTDVPADSYYANAVSWAVEGGITTGIGGGRFDPNSTCTRAQIATFLWRAMAE